MKVSCKEASGLMSPGEDGELEFGQRVSLRLHLLICSACARAKTQFAFLRRVAQHYPGPEQDGPPKPRGRLE